jgi:hypothetical protein
LRDIDFYVEQYDESKKYGCGNFESETNLRRANNALEPQDKK